MTDQEKLAWDKWVTILRNQDVQSASNAQFLLDNIGALEAERDLWKERQRQSEFQYGEISEKLSDTEAERDALAALVAEKDTALRAIKDTFPDDFTDDSPLMKVCEALLKSHPSVARARLVAEVVETAKNLKSYSTFPYPVMESRLREIDNALARLAAHDAKEK